MRPGFLFESFAAAGILVSIAHIRKYLTATFTNALSTRPHTIRLVPFMATLIVAAMLLGNESVWSQNRAPSPQPKNVSSQDIARLKQIIKGVVQNPNYLTPAVHSQFWRILAKTGASPAEIKVVRESMTGLLTVYYPMFWQDALTSLRNRRPYKSAQRRQYENKLLARRLITSNMIKVNDSLMAGIASGKPIIRQGQRIMMNEQTIQASLRNVQETAKRVDRLFTPGRR